MAKKSSRDAYYFPFGAKDWRSSESVRLMSMAEQGCFLNLLCIAWLSSDEPCSIPAEDAAIAGLLGLPVDEWRQYAPRVLAEFDVTTSRNRLRNETLWEKYREMKASHRSRVRGGKLTAAKRWGSTPPTSDSLATSSAHSSAVGSQSQSQSHSKDIGRGALAPRPAQFPDFTKSQCDALYAVWSRFGNPPYPAFRKALGPVLSGPDKRQFEDVKVGMEEAIRRAETEEREARFLTIHTFAQKVGYWIGEAKGRPVVDPSSGTLRRAI